MQEFTMRPSFHWPILRKSALAALLSAALPASAMYVNPHGTGQALLFPYYTVNAGQQTVFSVVNTTGRTKIAEVSFRESYNGRAVLRFDVVLAPHDTWTATTIEHPELDRPVPIIVQRNAACTSPAANLWTGTLHGTLPYQEFLPFDYTGNAADGGSVSIDRAREGYFHIVERAELEGELDVAAKQRNCAAFANLRVIASGPFVRPPAGGLRGSFAIVDVAEGTILGGNATAIDGFSTTTLLSATVDPPFYDAFGSANAGGSPVGAQVFIDGKMVNLQFPPSRAVDAISAVLMKDALLGDVTHESALGSNSEWVITAPTKRFHTDAARAKTQLAPFSSAFNTTHPAASCSAFKPTLFDRQGRAIELTPDPAGSPQTSPLPQFALCHATDVVSFEPASGSSESAVLGARVSTYINKPRPATETGSLTLTLGTTTGSAQSFLPPGTSGPGLRGLPVIGFEAIKYINANVTPGVLANYTLTRPLTSASSCTSATGSPVACP
jgi:hypothetical protein